MRLRITPPIVIGVGTAIWVIIVAVAAFLLIKPKYDANQTAITQDASVSQYRNDSQLSKAKSDLKSAQLQVADATKIYGNVMKNKNGQVSIGGDSRMEDWVEYCKEMSAVLPKTLNAWWLRDVHHHNANAAIPLGTLTVPTPSDDPDTLSGKTFTIPVSMKPWEARQTASNGAFGGMGKLPSMGSPMGMMSPMGGGQRMGQMGGMGGSNSKGGDIQVIGTFSQVLNKVASWNNFSRVAQIDGLKLEGYSPFVTATFQVTLTEFYLNADKPAPALNAGGTGGKGSAGGPMAMMGGRGAMH